MEALNSATSPLRGGLGASYARSTVTSTVRLSCTMPPAADSEIVCVPAGARGRGGGGESGAPTAKLAPLGPVSLFGWRPGWIAVYILFSIPISILLRKALNVV